MFINSRLLTLSQSGCGYICTYKITSDVVEQVVVSQSTAIVLTPTVLGGCCRQQVINFACVKCETRLNAVEAIKII